MMYYDLEKLLVVQKKGGPKKRPPYSNHYAKLKKKAKPAVVPVGDTDIGLTLEVRDPEILRMDDATGNMTALKEGETYVFLKNSDGEVIKGMPVWVTPAHKVNITAHPHPESRQLVKKQDYELVIDILNKEGKRIYPSKVRIVFQVV